MSWTCTSQTLQHHGRTWKRASGTTREDRISRDDAALQRQRLEQQHRRRDLVLIRRDRQIADDRPEFSREG